MNFYTKLVTGTHYLYLLNQTLTYFKNLTRSLFKEAKEGYLSSRII